MSELQIFDNEEFGKIRTLNINNEPWFVGKDVAEILGYKDTSDAMKRHVDEDDKRVDGILTPGGKQNMKVINESGLYNLVQNSKTKSGQFKSNFTKWLIDENLINECKVLTSRKEIEFKHCLEKIFETAKKVVESYINKENSKVVLEMIPQYEILDYKIDFYFPFFHIAIEYDEHYHKSKTDYDSKRQCKIENYFESKGSYINFIRVEEGNEEKAIGELIGHLINFSL